MVTIFCCQYLGYNSLKFLYRTLFYELCMKKKNFDCVVLIEEAFDASAISSVEGMWYVIEQNISACILFW